MEAMVGHSVIVHEWNSWAPTAAPVRYPMYPVPLSRQMQAPTEDQAPSAAAGAAVWSGYSVPVPRARNCPCSRAWQVHTHFRLALRPRPLLWNHGSTLTRFCCCLRCASVSQFSNPEPSDTRASPKGALHVSAVILLYATAALQKRYRGNEAHATNRG